MMYQIQADSFARGAFANGTGESFRKPSIGKMAGARKPVATSQDRSVSLPVLEQVHHHRRKRKAARGEHARRAAIFMGEQ
jgi:hypothetical protein